MSPSGSCSAASSAARSWARPCCRSASRYPSSPATRCPRWPTRRRGLHHARRSPGRRRTSGRWKIALAVALVMLTVVASYRQNVHAYPSGGGDYEVATVNLGRNAGLTVASALLVDYVLTVAVSISSASQNAASAIPRDRGARGAGACGWSCAARGDEPARRPRVGAVRGADVRLHDRRSSAWRLRSVRAERRPADVESATCRSSPRGGLRGDLATVGDDLPARAGVLSGCAALTGRGDLQRRTRVPQAEEPQRRDHAAAARRHLDHDAAQHHPAGRQMGLRYVDPHDLERLRDGRRRPAARRASTSTPSSRSSPRRLRATSRPASTSWSR